MSADQLLVTHKQHITRIQFNNPKRHNAMTLGMWESLGQQMQALERTKDTRVVVLSGSGEQAFVAGSDISQFAEQRSNPESIERYNRISSGAEFAVYQCPLPTIASVRGFCLGGGLGLAISCDIRICSEDASFAIPAGKLGLGYGYKGVEKLVDRIGPGAAAELFYTGRRFNADEALSMGLVNQVVAVGELDDTVEQMASRIASQAPLSLQAFKQALLSYRERPGTQNLDKVEAAVAACWTSADYQEGYSAFLEKRRPHFKGQ